ncbi:MAG: hypothetical protein HQL32_10760 [Planctomycetes bacterium]|nr:hypothetical protein [Planctomycetota bacterium]
MSDLNNMSLEDLVKFADEGVLPAEEGQANPDLQDDSSADEMDFNALSPEALLAMAEGKEVPSAAPSKEEPEAQEASEDELLAMLENTIGEDEFEGGTQEADMEIAKNIEKIKLRTLANKLGTMAPPQLFPKNKDEIYYFLSSMSGQCPAVNLENASDKCEFIGKALMTLDTYMLSEVDMSVDEQEVLQKLFNEFAENTVNESETRELVSEQFNFGWQNTLKLLNRDVKSLTRFSHENLKPIWVLLKFYESLSRAYGLCRALDSLKAYKEDIEVKISKEEKRDVVNAFEDILDLAPQYGLKKLDYINRKGAFEAISQLNLEVILDTLRSKKAGMR